MDSVTSCTAMSRVPAGTTRRFTAQVSPVQPPPIETQGSLAVQGNVGRVGGSGLQRTLICQEKPQPAVNSGLTESGQRLTK